MMMGADDFVVCVILCVVCVCVRFLVVKRCPAFSHHHHSFRDHRLASAGHRPDLPHYFYALRAVAVVVYRVSGISWGSARFEPGWQFN